MSLVAPFLCGHALYRHYAALHLQCKLHWLLWSTCRPSIAARTAYQTECWLSSSSDAEADVTDRYLNPFCELVIATLLTGYRRHRPTDRTAHHTSATKARFPSKRNRLRWQAANHGCQRKRLRLDGNRAWVLSHLSSLNWSSRAATAAIARRWTRMIRRPAPCRHCI